MPAEIKVTPEFFDGIHESYSGDCISENQPVRRPFKYGGKLYISTGGRGGGTPPRYEEECYELVDRELYSGQVRTYSVPKEREYEEYYESLRNDPNGFYHGMLVKRGSKDFVLVGPEVTFIRDEKAKRTGQLALF